MSSRARKHRPQRQARLPRRPDGPIELRPDRFTFQKMLCDCCNDVTMFAVFEVDGSEIVFILPGDVGLTFAEQAQKVAVSVPIPAERGLAQGECDWIEVDP